MASSSMVSPVIWMLPAIFFGFPLPEGVISTS